MNHDSAVVTLFPQESKVPRAILLLDPRLVVLPARPGTDELDAPVRPELGKGVVYEYTLVVRFDAEDGKGRLSDDGHDPATTPVHWPIACIDMLRGP